MNLYELMMTVFPLLPFLTLGFAETGGGEGEGGAQAATAVEGGEGGSLLGGGSGEGGGQAATSGGEAPAWMHELPDDLKGSASLSKFKGNNLNEVVPELAKSYAQLEGKIGANTVKVPGKNATDEEVAEYRKAVGVPDKPDDYQMPTEGIPEGAAFDEQTLADLKADAHKRGLTPEQAAGEYRWMTNKLGEMQQQHQQQVEQQRQEAETELKKEFGNAFQEKIDLAKKAIQRFGGDELTKALNETGAGDNPAVIKAMAQIGQAIASDEILGSGSGRTFGLSPAEAQSKINQKQADSQFMEKYLNRHESGHEEAVAEMKRLFEAAHPDEQTAA